MSKPFENLWFGNEVKTSLTSTNVKLRKHLRTDHHLTNP